MVNSAPTAMDMPAGSSAVSEATDKLEEYRQKVAGTNIDTRSLMCTDYFNSFNSVTMVLDMLPDAPELLDEVEQWKFVDYCEHFRTSNLDFAGLAIEAYEYAPPDLKKAFEQKTQAMRILIEDYSHMLRRLLDAGDMETFATLARTTAAQLRVMMESASSVVHGEKSSTQSDIDKLF